MTYEELAEITGAPMLEVNFYLPQGSVAILQRLDGFTDFNPAFEVLHCDKPGTGLVDALRHSASNWDESVARSVIYSQPLWTQKWLSVTVTDD